MAGARIRRREPWRYEGRQAQRQRGMSAFERRHPAVAVDRRRPENPRAGPAEHSVPVEAADGGIERSNRGDGLVLAAVRRTRGHVAREEPALAELGDVPRQLPGQRAAGCLHIPQPDSRTRASRGPRTRRHVAVEREHQDGADHVVGRVELAQAQMCVDRVEAQQSGRAVAERVGCKIGLGKGIGEVAEGVGGLAEPQVCGAGVAVVA